MTGLPIRKITADLTRGDVKVLCKSVQSEDGRPR